MKQLAFSETEYRARLGRVQAAMEGCGLGLLLLHAPENIYYLTGYQTSGHFAYQTLLVPLCGDPLLLIRLIERGWVDEYSWLSNAFTWREGEDVVEATVQLVANLGPSASPIGIEKNSWFLTVAKYEALTRKLAPRPLVDASLLVDRIRLVKSEAEIAYIKRAASIAEIGINAALEKIHDGASELEVAAAIHHAEILAGCEYTGLPHFLRSGYRTRLAHANWSPKIIRKGETVNMELSGCVARYHGAVIRTVCVGKPRSDVSRAAEILLDAQNAFLDALKPGAIARDVDALIRQPIQVMLRRDFYNRTGYSIGIGFPPRWGEWDALDFNEDSTWTVESGMTFHLVTGAVGSGVAFSETVAVRPSGAERLTQLPRELFVIE